jgi:hypothetical protein
VCPHQCCREAGQTETYRKDGAGDYTAVRVKQFRCCQELEARSPPLNGSQYRKIVLWLRMRIRQEMLTLARHKNSDAVDHQNKALDSSKR